MAHNPPNPNRFIENNPTLKAMALVAMRYGDVSDRDASEAIKYLVPLLHADVWPPDAVLAFEARPMHERRIGRPPKYPVTYDYEER